MNPIPAKPEKPVVRPVLNPIPTKTKTGKAE
jgi:hypothetical protein